VLVTDPSLVQVIVAPAVTVIPLGPTACPTAVLLEKKRPSVPGPDQHLPSTQRKSNRASVTNAVARSTVSAVITSSQRPSLA
jgi:hypothetical protein